MPKKTKSCVEEFFHRFPRFARLWQSKLTGYSDRMQIINIEQEKDGLYRLDILTTEGGEEEPYRIPAGKRWSYYFKPPAAPAHEIGEWGPEYLFRPNALIPS